MAPDLLIGRTALITGGGTGIGLAMGGKFAELGADLVLCGRRQEVLEAAATSLVERHPSRRVQTIVCDIRSSDAVETMLAAAFEDGAPDILVNNAGANFIAQSERLSGRAADAILNTSLHGALYCTIGAGRRWLEGGVSGTVLSILSTSIFTGRAFTAPSAMAKAGLAAMTQSLAVEWGGRGVRLVAIAPGSFPTEGASARLRPAVRTSDAAAKVPLGRHGDPHELAELAAFMVSPAASYMNGAIVTLDGGAHLRTSGVEDLISWTGEDWEAHRRTLGRR